MHRTSILTVAICVQVGRHGEVLIFEASYERVVKVVGHVDASAAIVGRRDLGDPRGVLSQPLNFVPAPKRVRVRFRPFHGLYDRIASRVVSVVMLSAALRRAVVTVVTRTRVVFRLVHSTSREGDVQLLRHRFVRGRIGPIVIYVALDPNSVRFRGVIDMFENDLIVAYPFVNRRTVDVDVCHFFRAHNVLRARRYQMECSNLFNRAFFNDGGSCTVDHVRAVGDNEDVFRGESAFCVLEVRLYGFFDAFAHSAVGCRRQIAVATGTRRVIRDSQLSNFLTGR